MDEDARSERLGTVARSDGSELRLTLQFPDNGPPIVSCRIWHATDPLKHKGFALRASEVAAVVGALVMGLDRVRELERRRRIDVERAHRVPPGRAWRRESRAVAEG
jgi:hypothetical protein